MSKTRNGPTIRRERKKLGTYLFLRIKFSGDSVAVPGVNFAVDAW